MRDELQYSQPIDTPRLNPQSERMRMFRRQPVVGYQIYQYPRTPAVATFSVMLCSPPVHSHYPCPKERA
jgi:hypothetical protein